MVDQILIAEQPEESEERKEQRIDEKNSHSLKTQKKPFKSKIHTSVQSTKEEPVSNLRTALSSIFKDIPIKALDSNSMVRKSISIDGQVYNTIKKMKSTMSEKSHGRFTFNMVIQCLLQDHVDLQNLRSELELIKKEMEDTQEYLKEMLKLALTNSKPQVQYIPISSPPLSTPPSVPPPTTLAPPKKINYKPPDTGNLMQDYVKEIKQLFKGDILRPSDVVGITKVKHKDSKIKELEEDCLIPDIELVSVAKNFKPIIEEESNV
jgi:hypothetical protein